MNMIPERSDEIILCTTTASLTDAWSNPFCTRYAMALGVNRDDQHLLMLSSSDWGLLTFKKVSCCPAKEAVGRSSAVAEERTATSGLLPFPSFSYSEMISSSKSSGILPTSNARRMLTEASCTFSSEDTSRFSITVAKRSPRPLLSRK